ncbi:MAG: PAS domain S-box protein [Dehalococcoidia bacterium]|nr:PAS domain S-box protein [Dehalococcoidia bacterium]
MPPSRNKADEVLRQAREALWAGLDYAPGAIYVTDVSGVLLYCNRKVEELTGYKKEELIGTPLLTSGLLAETQEARTRILQASGATGETSGPDEMRLTRKDGSTLWVEINTTHVTQPGGDVTIGFVRDVSARKQTERALEAERDRFRGYLHITGSAIVLLDAEGRVGLVNHRACAILGYPQKEILGKSWFDSFIPERFRDELRDVFDRQMRGEAETLENLENPVATSYGEERLIAWRTTVLREGGKTVGVLCSGEDVTESRRAQEQLELSRRRIEHMLKGMIVVIERMTEMKDAYTSGHQQRVAELSTAIARQLGLPEETCVSLVDMAARVHDIGKIAVPAEILTRPGKLRDVEVALIKAHPLVGYEILKSADLPYPVAEAVLQHHERLDGSGYPQGLSGYGILPEAQILVVADVVETMSSHRPYRASLGIEAALEEISRGSGTLYDSDVVAACLELFRRQGFTFSD